jgi:cysteine desulfurase
MKPSRVLAAMGIGPDIAGSVVRVSFGPGTSEADVGRFIAEWCRIKARADQAAA